MSSQHQSNNAFLESHSGIERFALFSDAVFAIAITLLALEIRLPAGLELHNDSQLLSAILGIWPLYLNYVISFLVIGQYWMVHHRMFRMITHYDRRLMLLNLLLLMSIGFIPFPTALLGEYTGRVSTIFYAITMIITGLLSALLWIYATMHNGHLLGVQLSPAEIKQSRQRHFLVPCVFLLSIVIALFNADLAMFSWLLLIPLVIGAAHASQKPESSDENAEFSAQDDETTEESLQSA